MEEKIVVESLEEMDRMEREGIIKPTTWERIAMCLIESNRSLDRIEPEALSKTPKRDWLNRFCLLTGTTFTGKDGHKYGNHKKDWKHMYEWSEALISGYIADIRILKKRIKVLEAVIGLCPECDKSALVVDSQEQK